MRTSNKNKPTGDRHHVYMPPWGGKDSSLKYSAAEPTATIRSMTFAHRVTGEPGLGKLDVPSFLGPRAKTA